MSLTPSAFTALGLDDRIVAGLTGLGYEEPTPIQSASIPPLIEGRDLVGQAATGTGKTAAFALPLIQRLSAKKSRSTQPRALVLVPTRELAMQVAEAVHKYGRAHNIRALPVYGGQNYELQVRALRRGVDVLIATPGRACDHLDRGTFTLEAIEVIVLDEADEMLDVGFIDDIESILNAAPAGRQVVLFSATLPPRINAIAKRHLNDPVKIAIARERLAAGATPKLKQTAYIVPRSQKFSALSRLLDVEAPTAAIIFCRTRLETDELAERLNARGQAAESLHGGLSQIQRERVLKRLKEGKSDLVVATDVAARGLDIDRLSHVVNFDVPPTAEAYVHRVGRVGRAGREGRALTLADPRQHGLLRNIERATGQKIDVAPIPSVADIRARRLEATRTSIKEAMLAGDFGVFRAVVDELSGEFDVLDVASAAIKVAHNALNKGDEDGEDIQDRSFDGSKPGGGSRHPIRERERERERRPSAEMVKLYIGAGRAASIRPQDLVGAITGEAGLTGRDVGSIEILDKFSLVEVPREQAAKVIDALLKTTIKGKTVAVRLDKPKAPKKA